jgi:polyhydroxybutyrate depolymerase
MACRLSRADYTRGVRPLAVLAVPAAVLLAAGCGSPDSVPAGPTRRIVTPAAACAASAPAPPAAVPGAPLDTILRVPARARGRRAPLLLALHFAGGSGAEMERATGYTPEARRGGFVVAYPTARTGGVWAGEHELGAVTRTLRAIERVACIDAARVYVAGMSNGGAMANLLACRMADRFAGAVLFAPAVSAIGDCRPARPIPVLEVHGTADPLVAYHPIPAFVAGWARLDGCGRRPRSARIRPAVTRLRWRGCRGGASVEHLRLAGGEHIELLAQLRAAGADPARTSWRFLAAHRPAR